MPRGFDGFYPGRGTQAFAERKSFFVSKQEIFSQFIELGRNELATSDQFKSANGSAILALQGYILPYFQHDSLDEAVILLDKKLHVVTKPGLAKDIGSRGIHNYTTPSVATLNGYAADTRSIEKRRQILQSEILQIRSEYEEYMANIFKDLFQSFHVSQSRKAMIHKILKATFLGFKSKF